jgi:predicted lipoprotein with Yx(FWY)xxD motif
VRTVAILIGLMAATTGALAGVTACAGDEDARGEPTRPAGATLSVRHTRYGTVLADGRGRILYEFTRDGTRGKSRCSGDCAVAWPPFLTRGAPRVRGVAKGGLGATRRRDGSLQVTYKGKPLYYYVTDTRPGQVTCQAVPEFGGTWYVTNPDGSTNRSPR